MKIIITEEQLKMLVENEKQGKLFPIHSSMVNTYDDMDSFMETYNEYKDVKGYVGIRYLGGLFINGNKLYDFCKNLVEVVGELNVVNNYIVNFPKLKRVGGDLTLSMTDVRELPNLEYVGGGLVLRRSKISELPKLESVGVSLGLEKSQINSLPNLKSVGGYLDLSYSQIKSLPNLEYVGGDLYLENTPLLENTTKEELISKINVGGEIYL